jgi:hypothetical protein
MAKIWHITSLDESTTTAAPHLRKDTVTNFFSQCFQQLSDPEKRDLLLTLANSIQREKRTLKDILSILPAVKESFPNEPPLNEERRLKATRQISVSPEKISYEMPMSHSFLAAKPPSKIVRFGSLVKKVTSTISRQEKGMHNSSGRPTWKASSFKRQTTFLAKECNNIIQPEALSSILPGLSTMSRQRTTKRIRQETVLPTQPVKLVLLPQKSTLSHGDEKMTMTIDNNKMIEPSQENRMDDLREELTEIYTNLKTGEYRSQQAAIQDLAGVRLAQNIC